MRAIVLTSSMRRHQFVANALASRLEVIAVWQEQKSFEPLRYAHTAEDEAMIQSHFAARDRSEAEFFAEHDRIRVPSTPVAAAGLNDPGVLRAMADAAPDVVLVFGTSLLKQPLIDMFPGRILNIHLGLSPFYRGAGTNFWPLVNREPEYCGATIHFLDAGIDTGNVIAHVRPDLHVNDGPHEIGNRTIVAAASALGDAAAALVEGGVKGVKQAGAGRLYKRADFSADAVRRLYANFADGMIDEYLRNRDARDAAVPLVRMQPSPGVAAS
jgi:folate-dependent phosphoribosylglycinamide formyltransferase PurN